MRIRFKSKDVIYTSGKNLLGKRTLNKITNQGK